MPVVGVHPMHELIGAPLGVLLGEGIGSLAQSTLHEPLGFAVGLRPVGAGESLLDPQFPTGGCEALGAEHPTVVGQQALDLDAQRAVVGDRISQELLGVQMRFLRIHVSEADARVIVDRHEQHLPPRSAGLLTVVSRHPVTGRQDALHLLGVHVQQIAGGRMLVALHRRGRLQAAEQRQARLAPELAPGALGDAQRCSNAAVRQRLAPQLYDRQRRARGNRARTDLRARAAVGQSRRALRQIPPQPLARRELADPVAERRHCRAQAAFRAIQNYFESTCIGQSGILTGVHSAVLL